MTTQAPKTEQRSQRELGRTRQRVRVAELVTDQLTRGVSARQISLTVVLGASLGVFPILGATTGLCFAAAAVLKLNHPLIQTANWLVAWAQIPLILVFVRLGEHVVGAPPTPFAPGEILSEFQADPSAFLQRFGLTGLHAILGWALAAPLTALALHAALAPALVRISANLKGKDAASC